ncbi:hypothetical protein TB1_034031 [Malus domestica]
MGRKERRPIPMQKELLCMANKPESGRDSSSNILQNHQLIESLALLPPPTLHGISLCPSTSIGKSQLDHHTAATATHVSCA